MFNHPALTWAFSAFSENIIEVNLLQPLCLAYLYVILRKGPSVNTIILLLLHICDIPKAGIKIVVYSNMNKKLLIRNLHLPHTPKADLDLPHSLQQQVLLGEHNRLYSLSL